MTARAATPCRAGGDGPCALHRFVEELGDRESAIGTRSGALLVVLHDQLAQTLHHGRVPDPCSVDVRQQAALAALRDAAPRDALEGMLAAQMVALHHAAMECLRRAHLPEQASEVRQANLGQAGKLSRTYATLLEALDKHRGKGQPQVVRVERVNVEAGGQAIVGAVSHPGGGGDGREIDGRARAQALAHEPGPRCGARTRSGSPCRSPAVRGKRRCRMHGGAAGSGGQAGNRNALKHGMRTAEVAGLRRAVRELLAEARELVEEVE